MVSNTLRGYVNGQCNESFSWCMIIVDVRANVCVCLRDSPSERLESHYTAFACCWGKIFASLESSMVAVSHLCSFVRVIIA
jgi:hypothetical protein